MTGAPEVISHHEVNLKIEITLAEQKEKNIEIMVFNDFMEH